MNDSVRPSVRQSVRLSDIFRYVSLIVSAWMEFSGGITIDRNGVHAKGQGQSTKVKVKEVKTNILVSGL